MIRLLEDRVPIVEVVMRDGEVIQVAGADLSDEGAEQLCDALRRGLVDCDVRVVRLPRILVVGLVRVPARA